MRGHIYPDMVTNETDIPGMRLISRARAIRNVVSLDANSPTGFHNKIVYKLRTYIMSSPNRNGRMIHMTVCPAITAEQHEILIIICGSPEDFKAR